MDLTPNLQSDCKCFALRVAKDVSVLAEGARNITWRVSEQNKQNIYNQNPRVTMGFLEDKNVMW